MMPLLQYGFGSQYPSSALWSSPIASPKNPIPPMSASLSERRIALIDRATALLGSGFDIVIDPPIGVVFRIGKRNCQGLIVNLFFFEMFEVGGFVGE